MHVDYKHHSPSSLNLFAAQPSMWVLEKCLGLKQPVGVPAHRGSAVESGVTYGLMHPDADPKDCFKEAYAKYDSLTGMSGDERREKYRGNIPDMVAQAIEELRPYGMPTEVQGPITQQVGGLKYPIIGYFDFRWDGVIVDLKTTERMPSEIKIPHARQVSFYCVGNTVGRLTYVTPKKCVTYHLENVPAHKMALIQLAKNVEYFLSKGSEPEDYVRMTAPDLESFYWGDPVARELAWKYWHI
jgi:hypothetical protein